jgi:hypothetical protein
VGPRTCLDVVEKRKILPLNKVLCVKRDSPYGDLVVENVIKYISDDDVMMDYITI